MQINRVAAECNAVWYATHVLSISDFNHTAEPQQMRIIRAAARAGLQVDQLDIGADWHGFRYGFAIIRRSLRSCNRVGVMTIGFMRKNPWLDWS